MAVLHAIQAQRSSISIAVPTVMRFAARLRRRTRRRRTRAAVLDARHVMKSSMLPTVPSIARLLIAIGLVSLPPLAGPADPVGFQGTSGAASGCQPAWLPTFGGQPGIGASNVFALATFDDGSGPALYAGGDFTSAGGMLTN